jgi:8-oxo-dGTP pyrophosphatase MutT (NUDIX family)
MLHFEPGIEKVIRAFQNPLPGTPAQHLMAPASRKTTEDLLLERTGYRHGGVLMLLFPDNDGIMQTVFIERTVNETVHSGQIAFPGGKSEPGDRDTAHTAIRETEEEIGVSQQNITLAGSLSPVFIPVSNYLVHPHVGFVETFPKFLPNAGEVKSIITHDILSLLRMEKERGRFVTSYGYLEAPFFPLKGYKMWGATAMMVSEFRELMRNELL